jgi:hypothetical protein
MPVLTIAVVLLTARSIATDPPNIAALQAQRAQGLLDELRTALALPHDVQVEVVVQHPLVFAVEPIEKSRDRFKLSMELAFLRFLDDHELSAALAHELGHVWIFTHHPFLQTERLANTIGQRIVNRESFEKVYSKLWGYEGTSGVPIDELLGPSITAVAAAESPTIIANAEIESARQSRMAFPGPIEKESDEGAGVTVWARGYEGIAIAGLDGGIYDPYRPAIIESVQRALVERGLYIGPVNGVLDTPTMKSIYAFQEASGALQLSGVPTPGTRALLGQGSHTDP